MALNVALRANVVDAARRYAIAAHSGQRYGHQDYSVHLMEVHAALLEYFPTASPSLQSAAWLHDAIEDTCLTYRDICDLFGASTADLVAAVTDPPGLPRKERKAAVLSRLRALPDARAAVLKTADRLANVRYATGRHWAMYRKEHSDFATLADTWPVVAPMMTEVSRLLNSERFIEGDV